MSTTTINFRTFPLPQKKACYPLVVLSHSPHPVPLATRHRLTVSSDVPLLGLFPINGIVLLRPAPFTEHNVFKVPCVGTCISPALLLVAE